MSGVFSFPFSVVLKILVITLKTHTRIVESQNRHIQAVNRDLRSEVFLSLVLDAQFSLWTTRGQDINQVTGLQGASE